MPQLSLCHLDGLQLASAYPLVRSAARVSAERWDSFARGLIAAGGGVIAARADDGCTHGVVAFRPLDSLRHGPCLEVELLVAFELTLRAPVRLALCAAIEAVAIEQSCQGIFVTPGERAAGAMTGSWKLPTMTLGFVAKPKDAAA